MKTARWTALLALVVVSAGCGAEKLDSVPPELVGTWTSSDPQYADRSIELQPKMLRFGTGEDHFAEHTVISLEREEKDGAMAYTVHYFDENMERNTWTFVHDRSRGNVIRLSHPEDVTWSKQPPL